LDLGFEEFGQNSLEVQHRCEEGESSMGRPGLGG